MIKALNKYSGLLAFLVVIITIYGSYRTVAGYAKDMTSDLAEHRTETTSQHLQQNKLLQDSITATNNVIVALNTQAIHQGYLKETVKNHTEATIELSRSILELNLFLERVKNKGYFEISKNGGL